MRSVDVIHQVIQAFRSADLEPPKAITVDRKTAERMKREVRQADLISRKSNATGSLYVLGVRIEVVKS